MGNLVATFCKTLRICSQQGVDKSLNLSVSYLEFTLRGISLRIPRHFNREVRQTTFAVCGYRRAGKVGRRGLKFRSEWRLRTIVTRWIPIFLLNLEALTVRV